ncbi:MAG: 5-deoxy-glucuronate isomerase, partial [Pseudomonadota bacterium]
MHFPPFDNRNQPIIDADHDFVPLNYFNIVKLSKGEGFNYKVGGYETCIVPATGTVDLNVEGFKVNGLGNRGHDVWDGEPEGAYVPTGTDAEFVCTSDSAEVFIAG